MSLRFGGLLVITGLTLAFVLGPLFVVAGTFMSVCGGIVAAVGMESALAREGAAGPARKSAEPEPRDG
jgi:hypothetical protein